MLIIGHYNVAYLLGKFSPRKKKRHYVKLFNCRTVNINQYIRIRFE